MEIMPTRLPPCTTGRWRQLHSCIFCSASLMSSAGAATMMSFVMTLSTRVSSGFLPSATMRVRTSRSEKMPTSLPESSTAIAPMLRSLIVRATSRTLAVDHAEAVVGRVFVRLAHRGEIEHSVDERVDRAAELHDHHADVQQLGRAL